MDKIAIIVAAGAGTRMGSSLPKQFIPLAGKPLLLHTVEAFIQAEPAISIILVLPENQLDYSRTIFQNLPYRDQLTLTPGGCNRFHSVARGLAIAADDSLIAVHDGVRCLVTEPLIQRCFAAAAEKGSAIPVIPATDTMRAVSGQADNQISQGIDRATIRLVQTPQTFQAALLKKAFAQPYQSSFTDEASVVEAMGQPVYLIQGEPENIKITRPIDLVVAEAVMKQRGLDSLN